MTPPSHHSTITPNWPIYWDSTMLGTLKECAKKFHYQHILGFQPRGLSIHLRFGQLYHAALERYDHARADGQDHEAALDAMVQWTLENSGEHVVWTLNGELPAVRVGDGWALRHDPRQIIDPDSITHVVWTPWTSDDPYKNRYTLIRSVVWFAEANRNSTLETVILSNGKPAVELTFNFPAFTIEGETVSLNGHMDKLVREKGTSRVWVADHKTTKSPLSGHFYQSFTPHNQFTLYTIAGRVVLGDKTQGVLVTAAQIGVDFTRFGQRPAPRPAAVQTEWLADAEYYITQAKRFAEANHWPMNDKSCGNYGGCPFARVCAVSPSHRLTWLKEDFVPFEWNPLKVRGDI